jgi:hypothetical protein
MSLDDIHHLFSGSDWGCWIKIADPGTILLGSLSWPTPSFTYPFNPFSKVSVLESLGLADMDIECWKYRDTRWRTASLDEALVVLPNGWTRYYSIVLTSAAAN